MRYSDTPHLDSSDAASPQIAAAARAPSIDARLLRVLLRALGSPQVRIVLWTGEAAYEGARAVATLRIADRPTLLRLLIRPELEFGEAYTNGRLHVDGDLVALLEAIFAAPASPLLDGLMSRLRRARGNTPQASRANIHHHYDIGDDFYRLWLDERMVYTCAYFATGAMSLEQAQVAKMNHVCRKVALRSGERVVDAGCGWGALALHMAQHFGVSVRAFNISHEQIAHAREQCRTAGLAGRVEFIEDDYRNISGEYDVFMSIGMLEHVGREHYGELGRVIDRCLAPQGRGLIHTIGRDRPQGTNAWLEKHIFPGAHIPTLREMMDLFEPRGFSVLDVENLRLHYAETLRHWLQRFEGSVDRVTGMFGERFVRAWRFYLAGSIAGFTTGSMQLFQVAFAREACTAIPWTRAHVYERQP